MTRYAKRRVRLGMAFACILMLVLTTVPVYADDISDLESKTSGLASELTNINQELVTISDDISTTEMQVEIINGEILRTQDSLVVAEENKNKQYNDMKSRIKFMYEGGNTSLLEMLFSAEDMGDFLNKAEFIQNVSDYDRTMLNELLEIQAQIEEEEAVLKTQQSSLLELQSTLASQQAELQAKADATSTDLAAFTAQLKSLRAEEARKAAELAAQQAQNGGGTIHSGGSMNVDASELDIFAAILQCEAYQDYDSLLAVATVIMNRVYDPRFPDTISGVVYAPKQFEPTWTGRMDTVLAQGATSLSYQVAQDALNGVRLASVADCYYFLYAGSTDHPGVVVGDNVFFAVW